MFIFEILIFYFLLILRLKIEICPESPKSFPWSDFLLETKGPAKRPIFHRFFSLAKARLESQMIKLQIHVRI